MTGMAHNLAGVMPEVVTLIGACVCMLLGSSSRSGPARATPWVAAGSLVLAWLMIGGSIQAAGDRAGIEAFVAGRLAIEVFAKGALCGVGLLLLALVAGGASGQRGPGKEGVPGEYYSFFLFSLTGAMLCAGARDLVWLFLALELTSIPTYVMVAVSRAGREPKEAAVKYFFLGAMAAAVFLYGFTLIYGATGTTSLDGVGAYVMQNGVTPVFAAGLGLALVGIGFKIAAVPMHFYAADVYQGASSSMTAFLAFVPKIAGFVSIIGLLRVLDGLDPGMYRSVTSLMCVMAVLTMTVGNTLALVQSNVKRVLAYSSVAHSGYVLVALVPAFGVGPEAGAQVSASGGVSEGDWAVMVYLIAYGLANVGVFAVLSTLNRGGQEGQTYDDLAGLARRRPLHGAVMLVSVLSLIGLPPLAGFVGKICLFSVAIERGHTWLVVVALLNSAASAVYYLRIASACYFETPDAGITVECGPLRWFGGVAAGVGVLVLGFGAGRAIDAARGTTLIVDPSAAVAQVDGPSDRRLATISGRGDDRAIVHIKVAGQVPIGD